MKHLLLWSLTSLLAISLLSTTAIAQPKIDTAPVGADVLNKNMSGADKLLTQKELTDRIAEYLEDPRYASKWSISKGGGNSYVIQRSSVQVVDKNIELPINLSEDQEARLLKKKGIQPAPYKITISFERFSKDKFLPNKIHNESVKRKILGLEKDLLYDMSKDKREKTRYAASKDQKDRLVNYWLQRTGLEKTYVENPDFFVVKDRFGYQVNIDYPYFERMYPATAGIHAKEIYDHIKLLLHGDYSWQNNGQ